MDFTAFSYHSDWREVDYSRPAGYFRHKALENVTRSQYLQMRHELYECYDQMIGCMLADCPYEDGGKMASLFTKLMEPCHYEQYLKINKHFYSHFCKL